MDHSAMDEKTLSRAASILGRKGGRATAQNTTPEQRKAIAKKASDAAKLVRQEGEPAMKTMDELPESIRASSFRNGLPQSPWDQGPTTVTPGPSLTTYGRAPDAVPIPGGEQISKAELADYSNRPDRNYAGAGRAAMPEPIPNSGMQPPREGSATSWTTQGAGGGNEPHPTPVTEWKGGKPEKPA
jgi:hypothetical protein